jgi:hypothetical protein
MTCLICRLVILSHCQDKSMNAPVVMILGTAASVAKSTLVTALCRIAARRGIRIAPFKAQNMSNNAAITADGGEITRSIAVQAAAARVRSEVTAIKNSFRRKLTSFTGERSRKRAAITRPVDGCPSSTFQAGGAIYGFLLLKTPISDTLVCGDECGC